MLPILAGGSSVVVKDYVDLCIAIVKDCFKWQCWGRLTVGRHYPLRSLRTPRGSCLHSFLNTVIAFQLTFLVYELLRLLFKREGDRHKHDHTHGREHLSDSVPQQYVNPANLHLQVPLHSGSWVRQDVHNYTQPYMQAYDHFHQEDVTCGLFSKTVHLLLDAGIKSSHEKKLVNHISKIYNC